MSRFPMDSTSVSLVERLGLADAWARQLGLQTHDAADFAQKEVDAIGLRPHPYEFMLYFDI